MTHTAHAWRWSSSGWSGSAKTRIGVCISVHYTVLISAGTCILQMQPHINNYTFISQP